MRTTVDIDDDVLFAARELAKSEKKTLGQVLSQLGRTELQARASDSNSFGSAFTKAQGKKTQSVSDRLAAFGIVPLASRGGVVSNELIDRLRNAERI